MTPPAGPELAGSELAGPWRLLFTGGPRLGWAFRDRRELIAPYPEPRPEPGEVQAQAAARAAATQARFAGAWKWAGRPSIGLAVILVLLSSCARTVGESGYSPVLTLVTAVILCLPGLGYTGWCWRRMGKARDLTPGQAWERAVRDWERRALAYADAELARLAGAPEWGSVPVPPGRSSAGRVNVFGGTLPGWQALIAVHGASLLSGWPLLIVDLTGCHVAAPLLSLAHGAGVPAVDWHFPADLTRSGLLNGLSPDQLAAAVADALCAEAPHPGPGGGAGTDRVAVTRITRQLAEVLAPAGVTVPRLAAAVRAALGYPMEMLLTPEEREAITGTLFPPGGARELSAPGLARLHAVLPGLAARIGDGWPVPPSPCTCLTLDPAARGADSGLLAALLLQWLTAQAESVTPTAMFPALIVAGAEEIPRAQAERLSRACEQRGIPLTLLFRNLRDDAAALPGGSLTAFMRLGNHAEADRAAAHLGRHHTFTMSSPDPQGARRAYEYQVDAATLQSLHDHALLLVGPAPGPPRLRAVECDPAIVELAGAVQ